MKNKLFNKVVGIFLSSSVVLTGVISSPPAFAEESSSNNNQNQTNNETINDPIVYPKINSFSLSKEKSDTVTFTIELSEDLQENNNILYLYKKGDSNIVKEVSEGKKIELTIDRVTDNFAEYYVSVGDQRSESIAIFPLENNDEWGLTATIDKTSISTSDKILPKISWKTKKYSNGKSIYVVDENDNIITKNGYGFTTSGEIPIKVFYDDFKTYRLFIANSTYSNYTKLSELEGVVASLDTGFKIYTQPWNVTGSVDIENYSTNNPKLTFTSTLNQATGGKVGLFLVEENSGKIIEKVNVSSSLTQKSYIYPKYLNEKNDYKFYVANFSGTITNKNQFEKIKAESNLMKTKSKEWEIQLSADRYTFYTEDKTPQLTVKANQPLGVNSEYKIIYLIDAQSNKIVYTFGSSNKYEDNLLIDRFYTEKNKKFKVLIGEELDQEIGEGTPVSTLKGIVAESNVVTIQRGSWEIYTDKIITYDDELGYYDHLNVYATTNQLLRQVLWNENTGVQGEYMVYLYDKSNGLIVDREYSYFKYGGSLFPKFKEGGIHKYGLVIAAYNDRSFEDDLKYSELTDIQAESETIKFVPSKWNVAITNIEEKDYNSTQKQINISFNSNKTLSSNYFAYLVNGLTGEVLTYTSNNNTISAKVSKTYNGTYTIYIAEKNYAKNISEMKNIRATSVSYFMSEFDDNNDIGYEKNERFVGGGNPSSSDCQQNCYGDPVNSYNGELFENNDDLSIDGDFPFSVSRNYSSIKKNNLGAFGYGWDFNYNMRIENENSSESLKNSQYLSIVQENGSKVVFLKNDDEESDEQYLVAPTMKVTLKYNDSDNTFVFERKDGTKFIFNFDGYLEQVKDRNENEIDFTRNSNNQITKIIGENEQNIDISWNNDKLISSVTDGIHTVKYSYNSEKELISVENSKINNLKKYTYYSDHKIQKIIHPNGGTYETFYDDKNRVIKQIDPKNNATLFEYSDKDRIITLPDGTKNKDTYFETGRLDSRTLAFGTSESTTYYYAYDNSGNMIGYVDPNNNQIQYSYDSNGNLMFSQQSGKIFRFSYNEQNLLTKIINPLGKVYENKYDSKGNLKESIDYNGKITKYENDSKGRLNNITNPNDLESNKSISYQYNSNGMVNKTIDTLGRESKLVYNESNNVSKMIDPMNNETKFEYLNNNSDLLKKTIFDNGSSSKNYFDGANRLIKTTDVSGNNTEYTYDLMDNVTSIKNVYGKTIYEYDSNNRVISETTPKGEKIEYEYNKLGLQTKTKYSNGTFTSNTYTKYGLLDNYTDAKGNKTTFSYDSVGNLISTTDALGGETSYSYDTLNRLTYSSTPKGIYFYYSYDDNGNMVSSRDSSQKTTENKYDDNGNLIKTIYPNGTSSTYKYNSENILIKTIDRTGKFKEYIYNDNDKVVKVNNNDDSFIEYSYDNMDNVKKVNYDNDSNIAYQYSVDGKITSSQSSSGEVVNYSYDAIGNLTARGPPNKEIAYSYNNFGEITTVNYPSGRSINYEYNNFDQLAKVKSDNNTLAEYSYDDNFNNTSTKFGNSNIENRSYDALNRLTNINVKNNNDESIFERKLTLDKDNYISNAQSLINDSKTVDKTYTYSKNEAIASIQNNMDQKKSTFTYDDFKNLTNIDKNKYNYTDNYNLNSSSINDSNYDYSYDKFGNRTSTINNSDDSKLNYQWDFDGTLKNVKVDDSVSDENNDVKNIGYEYDNSGLLESKSVDGQNVDKYSWDYVSSSIPVMLEDSSYDYIYGLDSTPFAQIDKDSDEIHYLSGDERNSVVLATDNSGNSVLTREYDEYGNLTQESTESVLNDDSGGSGESQNTEQENQNGSDNETADFNTNFGYAGEYLDKDTGLYNLRYRWYESSTGSFLSVDPAFDLTNDAYGYASGNPVSFTDPLGLWSTGGALLTSAAAIVDGAIGLPVASGLMNSMSPGSVDNCSSLYKGLSIASGVGSMLIPGGGIIKGVGLGVVGAVKYGPKIAKGISKFVGKTKNNQDGYISLSLLFGGDREVIFNHGSRGILKKKGMSELRLYKNGEYDAVYENHVDYFKANNPGSYEMIMTRADVATKNSNRNKALRGFPKQKNKQLDEFPYASTLQGGEGSNIKAVPISDNQFHGRDLTAFYRMGKINPGDNFKLVLGDGYGI